MKYVDLFFLIMSFILLLSCSFRDKKERIVRARARKNRREKEMAGQRREGKDHIESERGRGVKRKSEGERECGRWRELSGREKR